MSKSTAAPTDIPCHAVQSESLLRAHSCSPKRFSGLLDAPVPLRTNDRSPPPDKLDSHRLHIADIHHENSEALSMIDSACVLPAPQMETSGETVTTSAEASLTSLSEHRSPGKSLKASLEIEVAATKDELKLLRQQAAKVRSNSTTVPSMRQNYCSPHPFSRKPCRRHMQCSWCCRTKKL